MKKLLFAAVVSLLVLCTAAAGMCGEGRDMGFSRETFIRMLGASYLHVHRGFSEIRIKREMQKTGESSAVIPFNAAVAITMNGNDSTGMLKNIAVVMATADADVEEKDRHIQGRSHGNNNIVFEDACIQTIAAVDSEMDSAEARDILKALGIYGPVLDGLQHSATIGRFRCMMKLQPNGVIIMAISRI